MDCFHEFNVRRAAAGACLGLAMLLGCGGGKEEKAAAPSAASSGPAATPSIPGLDPRAKHEGPDKMGRVWYQIPGEARKQVFDPKTSTLFNAEKSASGEWKMTAIPEVTAESLGLGPGVKDLGKDPLGRYWFGDPSQAERIVYVTKTKQLHRATKSGSGDWKIGAVFTPQAKK